MKQLFTASPDLSKKRNINEPDQNILAEINDHIVAEIFAHQVFEQQPDQEHIKSGTPFAQDGDGYPETGDAEGCEFHRAQVVRGDFSADLPSQPDADSKDADADDSLGIAGRGARIQQVRGASKRALPEGTVI